MESIDFVLEAEAAKNGGVLSFRDFMRIALFAEKFGYYTSPRERVGSKFGTDFYTAASLGGKMFGDLIHSAAEAIIGDSLSDYFLVEIGAEPKQAHFLELEKFFKGIKTIRVGEPIEIPEKSILVANELLDAQPCYRLLFHGGCWREIGVYYDLDKKRWAETLLPQFSTETLSEFVANNLPATMDGEWHLDISLDAEFLLREILSAGTWRGAIIFLDYGKTLLDCLEAFPGGTARAYFRHTQNEDLTANPGEQDLTAHVLWDRLRKVVQECGFSNIEVLRQEAFFMKYSLKAIQKIIDKGAEQHSKDSMAERGKLLELIYPGKMGHAFQVLSAIKK